MRDHWFLVTYSLITGLLVSLKIFEIISWSWWWVTCLFWVPTLLIVSVFMFIFLYGWIKESLAYSKAGKEEKERERKL